MLLRTSIPAHQPFTSKLTPHPQLVDALGFSTILNSLPIKSFVKSILLSFKYARLDPSITTLAVPAAKTLSSSSSLTSNSSAVSGSVPGGGEGGIVFGSLEEVLSAGDAS